MNFVELNHKMCTDGVEDVDVLHVVGVEAIGAGDARVVGGLGQQLFGLLLGCLDVVLLVLEGLQREAKTRHVERDHKLHTYARANCIAKTKMRKLRAIVLKNEKSESEKWREPSSRSR
jgi:hypothetical protein